MLPRTALKLFTYNTCRTVVFRNISTSDHEFNFKPKFSVDEQEKILNTLNEADAEELSRFDVTLGRIKNLKNWRNKKGPFRKLVDILEVEGLGIKILERLCESIIANEDKPTTIAKSSITANKSRRQYVTPSLNEEQINNLSSAVGLHIGPNGISWAKICRDENKLQDWNFYDFSIAPKKMLPTDTFYLALSILDKIPSSEVYILEASSSSGSQSSQKQLASIPPQTQQLELTAMLLALLNTSSTHRNLEHDDIIHNRNKVYFLRSKLYARLFSTLIGHERVASTSVITSLLDNSSANFTLPCTPVTMPTKLRDDYYLQSPTDRELLGRALMLAIAFMDICIYKNPASHIMVAPGRR